MAERKEFQEKVIMYRVLEARLDSLLKQRELLNSKLLEIQTTLQSINEIIRSDGGVLFPIGSEAYTFGKVIDKKKIIVDIGANAALEKTVGEGKKTLENRGKEIRETLDAIQKSIMQISANLERLGPEIEDMAKSLDKASEAG